MKTDNLKPFANGYDPRRNTSGRPKNSLVACLRAKLEEVNVDDPQRRTNAQILADNLVAEAIKKGGNPRARELLISYTEGKPTAVVDTKETGPLLVPIPSALMKRYEDVGALSPGK